MSYFFKNHLKQHKEPSFLFLICTCTFVWMLCICRWTPPGPQKALEADLSGPDGGPKFLPASSIFLGLPLGLARHVPLLPLAMPSLILAPGTLDFSC